jgi:hypothetical protein
MSEDVDGAGQRPSAAGLLLPPLLLFATVTFAISFVASRAHASHGLPLFRLFFSNVMHMKAWLTTAAAFLALVQLLTAARIYEKLHFPPDGRFYGLLHRWSGRSAVVLTLPEAYHCILKFGFGVYDARAAVHSALGAAFYGAFVAKVFVVRSSGYPGWALPLLGGALFAMLMTLWLTSAFWLFTVFGVSL